MEKIRRKESRLIGLLNGCFNWLIIRHHCLLLAKCSDTNGWCAGLNLLFRTGKLIS